MHHIVLPSMVCPAVQNFTLYLLNGTVSKKKVIAFVCFNFLYNFCLERFSFWEELGELLY
jgi:hypothetical protein